MAVGPLPRALRQPGRHPHRHPQHRRFHLRRLPRPAPGRQATSPREAPHGGRESQSHPPLSPYPPPTLDEDPHVAVFTPRMPSNPPPLLRQVRAATSRGTPPTCTWPRTAPSCSPSTATPACPLTGRRGEAPAPPPGLSTFLHWPRVPNPQLAVHLQPKTRPIISLPRMIWVQTSVKERGGGASFGKPQKSSPPPPPPAGTKMPIERTCYAAYAGASYGPTFGGGHDIYINDAPRPGPPKLPSLSPTSQPFAGCSMRESACPVIGNTFPHFTHTGIRR